MRLIGAACRLPDELAALARARVVLRGLERVGRGPRCFGTTTLESRGAIRIGDRFAFGSHLAATHLAAARGAILGIGDDVTVECGAAIVARSRVSIGDRVHIGPYAVIGDRDPAPCDPAGDGPITIGDDAWIGAGVTLRPGVRVGRRAVIASGSVVVGDIDDGVLASGNPAVALRGPRSPHAA